MAITSLMYHCEYINNFVLLQRKFAVGMQMRSIWVIFADNVVLRWRQAKNNFLRLIRMFA